MSTTCPRCGFEATGSALTVCPRCLLEEEPPTAKPQDPPGLVLEEEIGRGGMGRVFRARHVRLERTVAVKFLPAELAADPAFEARFAREARALAALAHQHIVAVHDFGTSPDGQSYIVMEHMGGGTLAERLPVAREQAIDVVEQLCDALAYAHGKGIVHRDIKPENLLFDRDGRVKLADFGIARLTDPAAERSAVTRPTLVLGTPTYMAPEARAGAPPDPRMDVYAAGVLLNQIAEGPDVAAIVAEATALDPAQRLGSAVALRDRLRSLRVGTLPPDEDSWRRAVALTLAGATAVALYALLVSFTPRIVGAGDALPLISFGARQLPDGRVFTQARFETWPTLAAAAAFAVALTAYGVLRRHWRRSGLDRPAPGRPVDESTAVLRLSLVIDALFVVHLGLPYTPARPIAAYLPVVGGVLELVMLYQLWLAVLEAERRHRPLRRERRLWLGLALSLLPPCISFLRVLAGGHL